MRALLAGVFAAALAAAAPAGAATEVGANGNAFTGGLSFTPAEVTVNVGELVRWRNTDYLVPHTSTEKHDLWDLTGTYGQTPANPPGYAPGAVVARQFEAGTHSYYCRVHPREMIGTVAVPVALASETRRIKRKRRYKARRYKARRYKRVKFVVATWSAVAPAEGLVFDAERRLAPGGDWKTLRTGTRALGASFRAGRSGTAWEVRARLRRDGSQDEATDWSPVAAITR